MADIKSLEGSGMSRRSRGRQHSNSLHDLLVGAGISHVLDGGSRNSGFIARMLAETKLKNGYYGNPTGQLAPNSTMNAPAAFKYSAIPKPSKFIIDHFGPKAPTPEPVVESPKVKVKAVKPVAPVKPVVESPKAVVESPPAITWAAEIREMLADHSEAKPKSKKVKAVKVDKK